MEISLKKKIELFHIKCLPRITNYYDWINSSVPPSFLEAIMWGLMIKRNYNLLKIQRAKSTYHKLNSPKPLWPTKWAAVCGILFKSIIPEDMQSEVGKSHSSICALQAMSWKNNQIIFLIRKRNKAGDTNCIDRHFKNWLL